MNYSKLVKDMKLDRRLKLKTPCNHPIIFVLKEGIDSNRLNMYYDCVCLNCKERKTVPASICSDFGVIDPNNPAIPHENTIEEYLYAKRRYDELKHQIPFSKIASTIEEELVNIKNENSKTKKMK